MPRQALRVSAPLSRERIAEAAFALIDAEGLEGFSARRLAQSLKCEAMSLYHHVKNMDDVLDLVVDALLGTLRSPSSRDPRKALTAMAQAYLELADTHPNAFALAVSRRWRTPRALALAAATTELLKAMRLSPREALRRARALGAYLNGAGLALAAWRRAPDLDAPEAAAKLGPAGALSADAVRADLNAGLALLLQTLAP